MTERAAYVNGRVVPESEATVSIFDRGYLSGIGVFERTRTFHGELFRLDEHLDRLDSSLKMTRLQTGLSRKELKEATLDLVRRNRPLLGPNDDYSVGHYISVGPDGKPTVVIFCEPIPFKSFARQYRDGAHVVSPSIRQVPIQVLDPKLKTTSRMYFHLAECEAKLVDPEAYALILDLDGNVCELSPGANFWIVKKGTVITPPGRSMLRGITRDALVEVADELGIPVKEVDFQVYDVMIADEAFLTVTSRCVLPVTKVNGAPIGDGQPGPMVAQLQNGWAKRYGIDFVAQALAHLEPAGRPAIVGEGERRPFKASPARPVRR
jgi:branched-chain amino acid aminotransferase